MLVFYAKMPPKKKPKNTLGDGKGEKDDEKNWCPCNVYDGKDDEELRDIECEQCKQWWHGHCVGLKGLDEDTLRGLPNWCCPRCIMEKIGPTMAEMVKEEVCKTVPTVVKAVIEETTKSKEWTKSFTELFNRKQTEFQGAATKTIENTMNSTIKNNQDAILEKAEIRQNADNAERERRSMNIVLTNVRESEGNAEARTLADLKKRQLFWRNVMLEVTKLKSVSELVHFQELELTKT